MFYFTEIYEHRGYRTETTKYFRKLENLNIHIIKELIDEIDEIDVNDGEFNTGSDFRYLWGRIKFEDKPDLVADYRDA